MTTVSATKRLCQGAKLFAPLSGRAPSYTTPLVLTNSNNNNHNHNNGFNACQLNSLASQFSVMRLSSSSASPILSSSSSFHSSAAVDGAKAKPMAVKIRPLEELPPVPKRPLTAWLEFCRINRPMVRRAQPTLGGPELLKVMGEMWKRVSPTEKEKYTARARQRYEDYARAVEQWKASVSNEEQAALTMAKREEKLAKEKSEMLARQRREKKQLREELGMPKRPLSSYLRYYMEQNELRLKTGAKADQAWRSEIVLKFKKLPASELDRLKKQFDKDKKSYEVAMELWNKKMANDGRITQVK